MRTKAPWLTMHTVGNNPRNHAIYGSIGRAVPPRRPRMPAANLEPYYTGWNHSINRPGGETPAENSERDNYFARAMMYGSVLSGALAGHVLWNGGLRRHQHGRTGRMAAAHLDGAALRIRRADAAPAFVRVVAKAIATSASHSHRRISTRAAFPNALADGLDGWSFLMRTAEQAISRSCISNRRRSPRD